MRDYQKSLEKARELYETSSPEVRLALEKVFTELVEDEDERIRKDIISFVEQAIDAGYGIISKERKEKWIAWFEKQGKNSMGISEATKQKLEDNLHEALEKETPESCNEFLDKQGEEKSNPYSGVSFAYNGHTWGMCARDNGVEILIDGHIKGRVFTNDSNAKEMFIKALERVEEENNKGYKLTDCDKNSWWEDFKAYASCTVEHKPTDKVEPKFKVGDWITDGNITIQIEAIKNDCYLYCGDCALYSTKTADKVYHLWTIQDAKDGDVLAYGNDIVIFKENSYNPKDQSGCMFVYCAFNKCGYWYEIGGINPTYYKPATKEQRDTLMKAMADAGYTFDFEKKEIKKDMTITQEELKNYLKENLKISFITKPSRIFGCSHKKLIQLKLENELISESEIYD